MNCLEKSMFPTSSLKYTYGAFRGVKRIYSIFELSVRIHLSQKVKYRP